MQHDDRQQDRPKRFLARFVAQDSLRRDRANTSAEQRQSQKRIFADPSLALDRGPLVPCVKTEGNEVEEKIGKGEEEGVMELHATIMAVCG